MMYTANKETGIFIEKVNSVDDGMELIKDYERQDKENGTYTPNFYDVVDEEHNSVIDNDVKEIECYKEEYETIVELSEKYDTSEAHIILAMMNAINHNNIDIKDYL